jgi:hypothetical protein
MRKTKVKRPDKETATTARDDGHDSPLRGAPSAGQIEVLQLKNNNNKYTAREDGHDSPLRGAPSAGQIEALA